MINQGKRGPYGMRVGSTYKDFLSNRTLKGKLIYRGTSL